MDEKIKRVVVFIDGSNLYHVVKQLFPNKKQGDFNFEKFLKRIVGDKKLVGIYYYNCPLDRTNNLNAYISQQKFFEKLKKIENFNLILCRMQKVRIDGGTIYQVKEDDIHLAVDMVKLAYNNKYDVAILVSSDRDFVPVIQAVQEIDKEIENIGFENKFSYYLKQMCNLFVKLKKKEVEEFFD